MPFRHFISMSFSPKVNKNEILFKISLNTKIIAIKLTKRIDFNRNNNNRQKVWEDQQIKVLKVRYTLELINATRL